MKRCALLAVVPLAVAWRCQPPPRPRCAAVRVSAPPLAELAREQAELTLEEQAFADSFDDDEAARAALQAKQAWLSELSPLSVPQDFYRSEGYAVALEPLVDASGDPLLYSNGCPHGTRDEVVRQVAYAHERVIAQCVATNRSAVRATTIVNVRNPTFRFPDGPMRAAIAVQRDRYPWSARGKTIFVGMPAPVRWCFELCRSFMSAEQLESIVIADVEDLPQHAPLSSLPAELGGDAQWSMEEYIAARCAEEGSPPTVEVARYKGKRLDLKALDGLEAEPDGMAARALRTWRRLGRVPS